MDTRLAQALQWYCEPCGALVDQTHPALYRCADGTSAHSYEGRYFGPLGDEESPLASLLPVDDGTQRRPLDVPAIAALLGVQRDTVYKWRTRGVIPTEDGRVSDQPYWWPGTIERWATSTHRWQGYVEDHGPPS